MLFLPTCSWDSYIFLKAQLTWPCVFALICYKFLPLQISSKAHKDHIYSRGVFFHFWYFYFLGHLFCYILQEYCHPICWLTVVWLTVILVFIYLEIVPANKCYFILFSLTSASLNRLSATSVLMWSSISRIAVLSSISFITLSSLCLLLPLLLWSNISLQDYFTKTFCIFKIGSADKYTSEIPWFARIILLNSIILHLPLGFWVSLLIFVCDFYLLLTLMTYIYLKT